MSKAEPGSSVVSHRRPDEVGSFVRYSNMGTEVAMVDWHDGHGPVACYTHDLFVAPASPPARSTYDAETDRWSW